MHRSKDNTPLKVLNCLHLCATLNAIPPNQSEFVTQLVNARVTTRHNNPKASSLRQENRSTERLLRGTKRYNSKECYIKTQNCNTVRGH